MKFIDFKNLHKQDKPLVICNVWDVASAKKAEKLNFQAIGTSSSALADILGYEDGEKMSFSELEYIVKRIIANTKLPLSVDLEAGYAREPFEIVNHIKRLVKIGGVGINMEDSIVEKERDFLNAEQFAKTLLTIKNQLNKDNIDLFLNVRTDAFLLGHPNALKETLKRIKLYEKSGVDGVFVPCIEKEKDIKAIVESTSLPINVMCMPNLANFEILQELGVKRISMGNFLFDTMYDKFEQILTSILSQKSFKPIF
jgi:2-methylisocitrate lyase-like PEP mutase family enzyme